MTNNSYINLFQHKINLDCWRT